MEGVEINDTKRTPTMGRRAAVAAESFDPTCDEMDTTTIHPKTEEQLACLQEAAKDILFFQNCDREQQTILYNAMFEHCVEEDEVIIREGDVGDNFYIVEKGEYHILRGGKCVTLVDKGYFGELSLLYNCPRNATITAKSAGRLWGLDQKTFRRIVVTATAKKRLAFEELLKSVPLLDSLTSYELMNLTDALGEVHFTKDECIVRQGDVAEKMYFIMSGEVSVWVKDIDSDKEKEVTTLKRGQYFGELALVLNRSRVASVYSSSDETKCAVLDTYAFERLLGPCVDIMERNVTNYDLQRELAGVRSITPDINGTLSNKIDQLCCLP